MNREEVRKELEATVAARRELGSEHDDELISVVLQGTLSRAERALIADGKSDLVLSNRRAFQSIMRPDLIAGIEELTGRTVIAFLSDNSFEPDVKVKTFVLAPQEEPGGAPG